MKTASASLSIVAPPTRVASEVPAMNSLIVRLRQARTVLFAIALLAMASPLHAQNTHRAKLVRSSSQYLSAADSVSVSLLGDLTIEAWVKPTSQPGTGGNFGIVDKWPANQQSFWFAYSDIAGSKKLYFASSDNGTANIAASADCTLETGMWYHVAVVKQGMTATLYVNGVAIGTGPAVNAIFDNNSEIRIGGRVAANETFDGSLDEVRIWSVARTQSQIRTAMFNELLGTESGLKGYWKLNNSLTDSSGNGNTLTNNNSATFESNDLPFSSSTQQLEFCPDKDTRALWHLENSADTSGNGYTLSNTGVNLVPSKFLNGADLGIANGTNSLSVASTLGLQSNLPQSFACWFSIYSQPSNGTGYYVFFKDGAGSGQGNLRLSYENSGGTTALKFSRGSSTFLDEASYPIALTPGTLCFFTGTYDGTMLRLYLDGVLVASRTSTSTNGGGGTTEFTIGMRKSDGTLPLRGKVDEMLVTSHVFTAEEIMKYYGGIVTARFARSPLWRDEFGEAALDSSKWTVENSGSANVSNGIVSVAAGGGNWSGLISTAGRKSFQRQSYAVEFRARRTADYDMNFELTDGQNTISGSESSHWSGVGLRLNTGGDFGSSAQNNGLATTAWKEYRIAVDGTNVTVQRGDSLSNLTETLTRTLNTSVAAHSLYLRFSNAGPNQVEIDWIRVYEGMSGFVDSGPKGTWLEARQANTGTAYLSLATDRVQVGKNATGQFGISRVFYVFDSSSLPDTGIALNDASLQLFVAGKSVGDNDGSDYISVVQSTAAGDNVTGDDFDQAGLISGIDPLERKDVSDLATGSYVRFTLNELGRSWVSASSVTKLALREGHDLENAAYDGPVNSYNSVDFNSPKADTNNPYLRVEYRQAATYSITGAISASSSAPVGTIRVTAASNSTAASATVSLATPGTYNIYISNFPSGQTYNVSAYVDANENGVKDLLEWSGNYSGNPLLLDSDKTGINITIAAPVDSDGDGLPDDWEMTYFGTLTYGANDDPDHDGLTNIQELWLGTTANIPDTDGDGVSDGGEYNVYGTNPFATDTDGDGMADGWEVAHGLEARRNDANEDHDFDFLTNLQEYNAIPKLDPSAPNTGGSGTRDYQLLFSGQTPWQAIYDRNDRLLGVRYERGTSVGFRYDGNGNITGQARFGPSSNTGGLPAAWKYAYGLNANSSTGDNSPSGDPDHDGFTNWQEFVAGTDPNDPTDKPTSDGAVAATVASPFSQPAFVMTTGQLDGSGAEEIVVAADGSPGATNNTLTVLTQNGAAWTSEVVNSASVIGPVGITSLAISKATATTSAAIYLGTRAGSGGFGQVRKLTKVGGAWQSATLATSTDTTAWVAGIRDNRDAIVQLSQATGNPQALYTLPSSGPLVMLQNTTALSGVPILNRNAGGELGVTRRVAGGVEFTPLPSGTATTVAMPPATSGGQNLAWLGGSVLGSLVRGDQGSSPSIIEMHIDDKNNSGSTDGADDLVVTETWLATTAQTLTQSRLAIFNASSLPDCAASARVANAASDVIFTGEPGGNVWLWKSAGATAALQRRLFSAQYPGRAWHQLRAWRGLDAGDGLAGLAVAAATPNTCQVVVWEARSIGQTNATALTQTAPTVRIASTPVSGGAYARVDVKLWDSEANASQVSLQYQNPPNSGPWLDATLALIDGVSAATAPALAATPQGTTHQLIWSAASSLGASFQNGVLLRARAADFASVGAWSEPLYYAVDTTIGDADHDGLPDGWEIANGLNPALADALGDPDRDGLSNLMEFALGLNPQSASLTGTPSVFIGNAAGAPAAPGETGYLTILVPRNAAAGALQFAVKVSGDLNNWQGGSGNVTVLQDTPTLLKARDNTSATGNPKRYIRLEVLAP